jgi:Phage integrase family
MVFLRPGEFRMAGWEEFDLDNATWTVPAARMKREKDGKLNGKPHIVPLAKQAVETLRELHQLTGSSPYVFRGERSHERPMSDAAVNAALRAMGFGADEVTGHGFRATARTILVERLNIDAQIVEAQLAHAVKGGLGRAYDRTEFLEARREMMQTWADYLDELRNDLESSMAVAPLPPQTREWELIPKKLTSAKPTDPDIQYPGVLGEPIELPMPKGWLLNSAEWRSLRKTRYLEAWAARMPLLFQHFKLEEGDWRGLALALSARHVPGLSVRDQIKKGRPQKWTLKWRLELIEDLDAKRKEKKLSISGAARLIAKQEKWAKFLEGRDDPGEVLRTKYFEFTNEAEKK